VDWHVTREAALRLRHALSRLFFCVFSFFRQSGHPFTHAFTACDYATAMHLGEQIGCR